MKIPRKLLYVIQVAKRILCGLTQLIQVHKNCLFFGEVLEEITGKILSILGSGL